MTFLNRLLDERFFAHRQQSTSIAGVIGGALAICLFAYRYYFGHLWSWDLFAVSITIVAVKMAVMTWYYLTD